jgi:hypothetical protein
MSAVATTKCEACGGTHELYLVAGNGATPTKSYAFVCPSSAKQVPFTQSGERWRSVAMRPDGSVLLREG